MYLNQFQIVSSTLGNQTATILMIFRVRKSNFGSPDLKFHIFSVKYGFLLCHFIGRYGPPRQLEISRLDPPWRRARSACGWRYGLIGSPPELSSRQMTDDSHESQSDNPFIISISSIVITDTF